MDIDTLPQTPLPPHLGSLPCAALTELLVERNDCVPRALIDECARRGDEMVQALTRFPDDKRFWRDDVADGQWWMRLHAVMILGLIPSERAGLMLVRFMRRIAKAEDGDLEDWLAGAWVALFANKPQSAIGAVRDLASDPAIGWYMRACAFDVVTAAAQAQGPVALDRTLDWLAGIAADQRQDRDVRMWMGHLLLSFPRARHRALLDRLAAEQTGPYPEFRAEEVSQVFELMRDAPDWERFADPWKFYTPEEMAERRRQWEEDGDAWEAGDEGEPDEDDPDADLFADDDPDWQPPPALRAGPKVGRNDPCPCGSGKKYKHCHLNADEALAPDELAWRRVRRAIEGLQTRLMDGAAEHFGPHALEEAWREFRLGAAEDEVDEASPHIAAFVSWFCYAWLPDPRGTQVPPAARSSTAAQAFLARRGRQLDPLTHRYVEACLQAPFSFHEVQSCEPGRGFRLKDLLLGETRYVYEAGGSEGARRGDILYASVVEVDGVALVEGCGPVYIPPMEKPRVIALRAALAPQGRPIDRNRLRQRSADVRRLYIEITDRLLNPSPPQLQNTDGEPIEMRELRFDVPSARAAFDALKDLAGQEADEALLSEATFDESGDLSHVELPWVKPGNAMHKAWNNTVLGTLRIDGSRLTAAVNSAARAQRLSDLIAERLGERARKLPDVIQSVQSLRGQERTRAQRAAEQRAAEENAELNSRPEVQALIAEMTRKHYRGWVDQPVRALGNRTPRHAMRSADGREAVEALVVQLERDAQRMQPPLDPSVTRELRATLGLPPAPEE